MKTVQGRQPPTADEKLRGDLQQALSQFADGPLRGGAEKLLSTLGYRSERTTDAGSIEEFLDTFDARNKLTARQLEVLGAWRTVEIVFQVTSDEIAAQENLFGQTGFDKGWNKSFLFLAVDLSGVSYNRTDLADMTRAVNRLFDMPVIVLFRYDSNLTLAVIHRRAHKRNDRRAVLKKVTLIKDVDLANPHRAHIDILAGLSMQDLTAEESIRDFDALHDAWESKLNIEELNRRFYRELFSWFERASAECSFPNDGAGEGNDERHVIRLITRLLFIWFLKEKGLVPDELFKQEFAAGVLKEYDPDSTDYYRAVLQNLFFATLNTAIDKRDFSSERRRTHRDFSKYRYRKLLTDPDGFLDMLKTVPFVNGGLFDCLDDFEGVKRGGRRIDAFTDVSAQGRELSVPARLFFDTDEGLFPLFRNYKFTVEENTPLDQEVALDPELLGRAFENLLGAYNPETSQSARKATGSYYTPRSIVDYMVDEALLACFLKNTPPYDGDRRWLEDRLRLLLAFDQDEETARTHAKQGKTAPEADHLIDTTEIGPLIAAVDNLKILDPACGSGAFPMGILQKLVLVLAKLDPRNQRWKARQLQKAESIDDPQAREKAVAAVESAFAPERGFGGFGRKLYLIRNAVHGVDIQPIACQIAKLRFFISLVIEQPTNSRPEDNYGIQPLPNLETHFVAADTLIGLQAETTLLLLDDAASLKRKEIAAVRERYFLANSRPKKIECIVAEKRLREELREILENERQEWIADQEREIERKAAGFSNQNMRNKFRESELRNLAKCQRKRDDIVAFARNVAEWDPYDQNTHAAWFDPEWMFGVSEGFDIVIGNPPYIQLQKDGGRAGQLYRSAGYETFQQTGDIYQLFYERGCGLLKHGTGVLAYITSNSWLKAEYGKPLRQWFAEHHMPLQLIEMGKNVFENAIVDTAVLIVRNGNGSPVTCRAMDVEEASDDRFPPPNVKWGTLQPEGDRPWMALSSVERAVMEKMEDVGTPLRDWDISIYRGILTGYNTAFIVNQATRDALVAADPRSVELLKPVLRGRDIARYRANWAGLWLISTLPSLSMDIDAYPAIKRHLLSFGKERLAQEGRRLPGGGRSRKKTPNAWYELQDTCAYHEVFKRPKLLWKDMTDEGAFAYSETEVYTNDKAYMMTGKHLKYLCAVLNSTAVSWLVTKTALTTGMGLNQWKKFVVEQIPIIRPDERTLQLIGDKVTHLMDVMEAGDEQGALKTQADIDRNVCELYSLSGREIKWLRGVKSSF